MLIVQKYGGTSIGDPERIKNVARRILSARKKGHQMVVVVSAMAGETNRLVDLARQVSREPDGREYDQLVSTGEQVTIALLALALQDLGGQARSFLGHQVRIMTDSAFSKARIKSIDAGIIHDELKKGHVVVIAGFQGIDPEGNITTLGRGGSDTTAVALAAALKAESCEIYTDVDGVYTADPRIVPEARKLDKISYEEMLELASLGAKVLQIRSVEMAAKYKVPLWVKSSFTQINQPRRGVEGEAPSGFARGGNLPAYRGGCPEGTGGAGGDVSPCKEGTLVVQEDKEMEKVLVSGIAHDKNEAKLAVRRLADRPGVAARLFEPLAAANINVDMIIQNLSADGFTDMTFTVPRADLRRALRIVEQTASEIGAERVESDEKIAKVSIVGVGMRSHSGVAARMFSALAHEKINIQMISTSEIKVSVVIDEKEMERAVKALHKAFELEK